MSYRSRSLRFNPNSWLVTVRSVIKMGSPCGPIASSEIWYWPFTVIHPPSPPGQVIVDGQRRHGFITPCSHSDWNHSVGGNSCPWMARFSYPVRGTLMRCLLAPFPAFLSPFCHCQSFYPTNINTIHSTVPNHMHYKPLYRCSPCNTPFALFHYHLCYLHLLSFGIQLVLCISCTSSSK